MQYSDEAIAVGCYSYPPADPRYQNEWNVANTYRLVSGPMRVTLWFQPVIYGDAREENGVSLHRVSPSSVFLCGRWNSAYTPDYLLEIENAATCERRVIVIDAKFCELEKVVRTQGGCSADRLRVDDVDWLGSELSRCMRRYGCDVVNARSGRRPDAAWLICGNVGSSRMMPLAQSGWSEGVGLIPSGACSLVPGGARIVIDDLLDLWGAPLPR